MAASPRPDTAKDQPLRLAFVSDDDEQRDVQQGNRRESIPEVPMPGLMAEEEHAGGSSSGPAQQSHPKQRLFGDAVLPSPSVGLVQAHEDEFPEVNDGEIYN